MFILPLYVEVATVQFLKKTKKIKSIIRLCKFFDNYVPICIAYVTWDIITNPYLFWKSVQKFRPTV